MSDEEKLELLDLLLGGDQPPLMVGPVSMMPNAPMGIAVAMTSGGVAVKPVSPRTQVLLGKYVGVGK